MHNLLNQIQYKIISEVSTTFIQKVNENKHTKVASSHNF